MNNYPSFGPLLGQFPEGKTAGETIRALSSYNPANFAPYIQCPAYMGSNIGDVTVHSLGPLAVCHNLTALAPDQKAFYPGFTHFHGSGPGLGTMTREILAKLGGPEPPQKTHSTHQMTNPEAFELCHNQLGFRSQYGRKRVLARPHPDMRGIHAAPVFSVIELNEFSRNALNSPKRHEFVFSSGLQRQETDFGPWMVGDFFEVGQQ